MRIVIPYRQNLLHPDLVEQLPCARYDEMLGDHAYAGLLRDLIEERKDTILVEHDIVPSGGQLLKLWECPSPWCAHAYEPFAGRDYSVPQEIVGLGLCKLGSELLKMMNTVPFPRARWDHCDFIFTAFARQLGFVPHQHTGDVIHHLTRHGGHYP